MDTELDNRTTMKEEMPDVHILDKLRDDLQKKTGYFMTSCKKVGR